MLKMIYKVFIHNLRVCFKESILFNILQLLIPEILHKFQPSVHNRLSKFLDFPVLINSPYFSILRVNYIVDDWYKNSLK